MRHATRGVGPFVAAKIEELGGFEVRTTVLGHLQRGGSPTARDRIFATRVGTAAYDAAVAGKFGMIPVVREDNVVLVPISSIATGKRKVPREILRPLLFVLLSATAGSPPYFPTALRNGQVDSSSTGSLGDLVGEDGTGAR